VGGNPAAPLYQRFAKETVRALRDIAWWNWEIDKVTRNLQHIVAADIETLRRCE
jgi:virginiamycin A acetyltransferase